MNNTLKTVFVIILGAALIMITGCAEKEVEFFHGGYPNFQPGPEGGADLVEIKKEVDFKVYKYIIMDPAYFRFDSAAQYNAIPQDALKDLRETFNQVFVDALDGAYPLVKHPRPDALRVRVAIMNLVPLLQGTASDIPISAGGASMKAEILDSMTNERLGAVIDTKTGYKNKAVKNMDEWKHTKDVFKFWAQRLRNWLDETHGRK